MNSQLQTSLAPPGIFNVAINVENPILVKRSDDLTVAGVSVDMTQLLAQKLGLLSELVVFEFAGESVQAVIDEGVDVSFFEIEPKRVQEIAFTDACVLIEGDYLARDDSFISSSELVDQPGVPIALGMGSAYDIQHQLEVAAGMQRSNIYGGCCPCRCRMAKTSTKARIAASKCVQSDHA